MTHRSTGGGQAPAEAAADLAADDRAGGDQPGHRPRDVGGGDEEDAGHRVDDEGQRVLGAVEALEVVVDEDGQQGDEDHPLGRPEVAAVDAGEEDAGQQAGAPVGPPVRPALEPRRSSGAGAAISTAARAMRTGTAALNTLWGRASRRMAPISPPTSEAEPSWISRSPLPDQLAPVGARWR